MPDTRSFSDEISLNKAQNVEIYIRESYIEPTMPILGAGLCLV